MEKQTQEGWKAMEALPNLTADLPKTVKSFSNMIAHATMSDASCLLGNGIKGLGTSLGGMISCIVCGTNS